MLLTTILMLLTNSLMHQLSQTYSAVQIVFFKGLFGCVSLLPMLPRAKIALQTAIHWRLHFSRAFIGLIGNWLWVKALSELILADATALSLLSVIWGLLGAFLILKEPFRWHRIMVAAVALFSAFLILKPGTTSFRWEYCYAVGSSMSYAMSDLILRYTGKKDHVFTSVFVLTAVMTILGGIMSCWFWKTPNMLDFALLGLVGILYGIGQLSLAKAYALAEASFLAPIKLLRYPLMMVVGFIFFAEIPHLTNLLGASGILLSLVFLVYFDKRKANLQSTAQEI